MQTGQARLTRPGRSATGRPFLGMLAVAAGTLVVPFDSSVNVAFPQITRAFGLPIPAIQWVVIAYTLTYAALMLVFGRAGDMFGYRRIFMIGCGWSMVAFVGCATAQSFAWLLAARVMQGVGAALALSCGPALATSLYPENERTRILGLYTMIFGLGGAFGPVLAGQLVQRWDWESVFWFRAPIAAFAFLLAWVLPRGDHHEQARFDAPGAVLMVAAISGLLFTLNQFQHLGRTWWELPLLGGLTVAAGAGFVIRERRTPHPLIDLRYFHNRDFALVNVANMVLNIAGFSIMLLVPFFLDRVVGLSVPLIGIALAAGPGGVMIAGPVAGRMTAWISPRRLALTGAAILTVAQFGIGCVGPHPIIVVLMTAMVMHGFGLGLFQVAYFDIATVTLPRQDRGVAGSLVMMTRTIGVVTGATVLMLLFQTLRGYGLSIGMPETRAFMHGFHGAFWLGATLPFATLLAGLACGWARSEPKL